MRCRRGNEPVALLARLLSLRGLLGEIFGGGRIGLFARAVEAFPQRFGNARVLLVERLPFVAQFLHFKRELRRIHCLHRQGLGALA